MTSATAQVTFKHVMDHERDWDGGILEISIAGGAFQDIIVAGGAFVSGGYNLTLLANSQSPIAGKPAWNGELNIQTVVNLPATASGKNIVLRWRSVCDEGVADLGWWIDDVVVKN
jgi:hypothetical protein